MFNFNECLYHFTTQSQQRSPLLINVRSKKNIYSISPKDRTERDKEEHFEYYSRKSSAGIWRLQYPFLFSSPLTHIKTDIDMSGALILPEHHRLFRSGIILVSLFERPSASILSAGTCQGWSTMIVLPDDNSARLLLVSLQFKCNFYMLALIRDDGHEFSSWITQGMEDPRGLIYIVNECTDILATLRNHKCFYFDNVCLALSWPESLMEMIMLKVRNTHSVCSSFA